MQPSNCKDDITNLDPILPIGQLSGVTKIPDIQTNKQTNATNNQTQATPGYLFRMIQFMSQNNCICFAGSRKLYG